MFKMVSSVKVLILILTFTLIVESLMLIYCFTDEGYYKRYCYLDQSDQLGFSNYCRKGRCAINGAQALNVKKYIHVSVSSGK